MKVNQIATIKFACGCEYYLTPGWSEVPPSCPEHWSADKPIKMEKVDK